MTERERFERYKAAERGIEYERFKLIRDIHEENYGVRYHQLTQMASDWKLWQAATAQVEADKWISVDDQLPEMYKRVLIKADSSCVASREPNSALNKYWGINGDWVWAVVNDSYYDSHMVTHWRPLPEPPTVQNGE